MTFRTEVVLAISTRSSAALTMSFDNPFVIRAQGSRTVPHQVYHNVLAGYRFAEDGGASAISRVLADVSVTLGVRNLFNTLPPFDAAQQTLQYYSPFGDYRLRSAQLSIGKRFRDLQSGRRRVAAAACHHGRAMADQICHGRECKVA